MQQLIPCQQQLADLLRQTAAARQAFAVRRRLAAEVPLYQVKPAGRGFFHIVETATGKVRGFRRSHNDACQRASELERMGRDNPGTEG
jgi:hypothetical protein